jgi:hypothetical protein
LRRRIPYTREAMSPSRQSNWSLPIELVRTSVK